MPKKRTTTKRAAATTDDGAYMLRGIDRALWADFAERATADGIDMRAAILLCVRGYVAGRIQLIAQATGGEQ